MMFANLGEFAAFMATLAPKELALDTLGREKVAKLLKSAIKAHLGGPVDGPKSPFNWAPLADSTVAKKGHDRPLYETGALRDSIDWGHEAPRKTVVGSTDEKAPWHEFGPSNGRFPRRSFLAGTANEKNDEAFALYVATMTRLTQSAAITGSSTVRIK